MEEPSARDRKDSSSAASRLFEGKQFWLSLNIPQRRRFKELIEQHGGIIRLQENDADILLVDHTKKNLPANSFSYQWVERSVRNGRLEPLDAYRAGPSPHRPMGATHIPTRGHRVQFTLEDDQTLWDYMQPYERDPGAPIRGYSIFKALAEKYPRHTYQSYRERYKKIRGSGRPGGMAAGRPAAPGESNGRRFPAQPPPTSNANQGHHTQTDADHSSVQEAQKRKRSPDDEPSESFTRRQPETPKRKTKVVDMNQEPGVLNPLQTQETAERRQQPPESTNRITRNAHSAGPEERPQPHAPQDPASRPEREVDPLFLELPFLPSSPEPEEESADLNAWIDARLEIGSATQVIEALRCTSMNPSLADKVLPSLVSGKGIPSDMPGVWTPEDDETIEGNDARSIGRAIRKHGTFFFNLRWKYLSLARDTGLRS